LLNHLIELVRQQRRYTGRHRAEDCLHGVAYGNFLLGGSE
jgi:hypothetical protein